MMLILSMLIASAAGPYAPFLPGRTAIVFSTIGHSEWCPAGNVRLDLATGRYAVTPTAPRLICTQPNLERPVFTGRLKGTPLADLQRAIAALKKKVWTVAAGAWPPSSS